MFNLGALGLSEALKGVLPMQQNHSEYESESRAIFAAMVSAEHDQPSAMSSGIGPWGWAIEGGHAHDLDHRSHLDDVQHFVGGLRRAA